MKKYFIFELYLIQIISKNNNYLALNISEDFEKM